MTIQGITTYTKQYSSESTLIDLIEDWRKALNSNEKVYLFVMDMSKAFDSLHHSLTLLTIKILESGFQINSGEDQRVLKNVPFKTRKLCLKCALSVS